MSKHFENISKLKVELWEADEYVIVLEGVGPIGSTLHKTEANTIRNWLATTNLLPAGRALAGIENPEAWVRVIKDLRDEVKKADQKIGWFSKYLTAISKAEGG